MSAAMVLPNLRGRETHIYFCFVLTIEFKKAIISDLSTKIRELTACKYDSFPGFKYCPISISQTSKNNGLPYIILIDKRTFYNTWEDVPVITVVNFQPVRVLKSAYRLEIHNAAITADKLTCVYACYYIS
jgi:hypothetical protein